MSKALDEIRVWFDVEIGHHACPADETEQSCKCAKLLTHIANRERKARIDELEDALKPDAVANPYERIRERIGELQAEDKGGQE